jgi:hypothetical protein
MSCICQTTDSKIKFTVIANSQRVIGEGLKNTATCEKCNRLIKEWSTSEEDYVALMAKHGNPFIKN